MKLETAGVCATVIDGNAVERAKPLTNVRRVSPVFCPISWYLAEPHYCRIKKTDGLAQACPAALQSLSDFYTSVHYGPLTLPLAGVTRWTRPRVGAVHNHRSANARPLQRRDSTVSRRPTMQQVIIWIGLPWTSVSGVCGQKKSSTMV
jgi:hypothetical protein